MPWYLEIDAYPYCDRSISDRRISVIIDCPDNFRSRRKAHEIAKSMLKAIPYHNPLVVWKEKLKKEEQNGMVP